MRWPARQDSTEIAPLPKLPRLRQSFPLLLVAGGSGLVPLMATLRHRATRTEPPRDVDVRLLVPHGGEGRALPRRASPAAPHVRVHTTLTAAAAGWAGLSRRVDADMLLRPGARRRRSARASPPRADRVRREAWPTCWSSWARPAYDRCRALGPTGSDDGRLLARRQRGRRPLVEVLVKDLTAVERRRGSRGDERESVPAAPTSARAWCGAARLVVAGAARGRGRPRASASVGQRPGVGRAP